MNFVIVNLIFQNLRKRFNEKTTIDILLYPSFSFVLLKYNEVFQRNLEI